MNDGMEGTRPEVAGLGGENSLTGSGTGVDVGVPVGNGPEVIGGENVVGSGELTANDATNGSVPDVNGTEISGAGMPDMNGGNMEPVASEPIVGSIAEPVASEPSVAGSVIESAAENVVAGEQKTKQSKKTMYIAAGVAGIVILGVAGVGIYAAVSRKESGAQTAIEAEVKTDMETRKTENEKILAEEDIQSKTYSEMTDEEREHNAYIMYGISSEVQERLMGEAEEIDDQFMDSKISFEEAKAKYEEIIEAQGSDAEKAYLLLRAADFIAFGMGDNSEGDIALMGEMIMRAEEISPSIASADKAAYWQYYYGSVEKSKSYYQLQLEREKEGGYIQVIPDSNNSVIKGEGEAEDEDENKNN